METGYWFIYYKQQSQPLPNGPYNGNWVESNGVIDMHPVDWVIHRENVRQVPTLVLFALPIGRDQFESAKRAF